MLKLKQKMKQMVWFASGFAMGLTGFSAAFGSVPSAARVTDDTAIYQKLSEIQVPKQGGINFDADIAQLSRMEVRYHETLPVLKKDARVTGPMNRIAAQKYRRQ